MGEAIIIHLDHKVIVLTLALQQVALHSPNDIFARQWRWWHVIALDLALILVLILVILLLLLRFCVKFAAIVWRSACQPYPGYCYPWVLAKQAGGRCYYHRFRWIGDYW